MHRAEGRQISKVEGGRLEAQWDQASSWYDRSVGDEGHYYHQNLIVPRILEWVKSTGPATFLVDLGCGQGVLQRHLPDEIAYLGIDASLPMLRSAKRRAVGSRARFAQVDLCKPWRTAPRGASHAALVLSLQNMSNGRQVLKNAAGSLKSSGQLLLVLNHPCFRIPRQSSWHVDVAQKTQGRCVHSYLTDRQIPIATHPGRADSSSRQSAQTFSYHHPLGTYVEWLVDSGFAITRLEEWASDKVSTGKWARSENRARREIPLFLALRALKTDLFKKGPNGNGRDELARPAPQTPGDKSSSRLSNRCSTRAEKPAGR